MFDLTGRTGSYFYMAPEVLQNEPYNEKARPPVTLRQLSVMRVVWGSPAQPWAWCWSAAAAFLCASSRLFLVMTFRPSLWALFWRQYKEIGEPQRTSMLMRES